MINTKGNTRLQLTYSKNIKAFQKKIKYDFSDENILQSALTHSSISTTHNYELLEFLGDRVLALVIGHYLLQKKDDSVTMRKLSTMFNYLICRDTLCDIAKKLGLQKYLNSQNDVTDSMLADCMEAVIGAIYRDSSVQSKDAGLSAAEKFLLKYWRPYLNLRRSVHGDPKMQLQEWTQRQKLGLPNYHLIDESLTSDGKHEFKVSVEVTGHGVVEAVGTRKQRAEQAAALRMLKKLTLRTEHDNE